MSTVGLTVLDTWLHSLVRVGLFARVIVHAVACLLEAFHGLRIRLVLVANLKTSGTGAYAMEASEYHAQSGNETHCG